MFVKFEPISKFKALKTFKETECFYYDGLKMKPVCDHKDIAYAISKDLEFHSIRSTVSNSLRVCRIEYKEIDEKETAKRLLDEDKSVIALIDKKHYQSVRDFDVFTELVLESESSIVCFFVQ